jgi:hypothetical protein
VGTGGFRQPDEVQENLFKRRDQKIKKDLSQRHAIVDFKLDVKRVLKPGGRFIARCPNGDSPFRLVNQNGDVTQVTSIAARHNILRPERIWN